MFQSAVITLREGLEAFLIVAISLAYLRQSARLRLVPAVYWGIGTSVAVSVLAGALLQRAANEALWEGILALVAAVLVATLTIHMWRTGKHMRRAIHQHLESSAVRTGAAAWWGVFGFTVLMISREGMETAVLFNALIFQVRSTELILGAVIGVFLAAALALLWSHYGHRINLALFLQVSAVFLLLFVAQLFISGVHELTEANVLPYSEPLHWATEPYGPDGRYGKHFSYLLVLVPAAWLVIAALRSRHPATSPAQG